MCEGGFGAVMEVEKRADGAFSAEDATVIDSAMEDIHTADHDLLMATALDSMSHITVGCRPPP